MRNKALILFFMMTFSLIGQSIHFSSFDKSRFPILKVEYFMLDKSGNQVYNLKNDDFEIKENGLERKVININCPENNKPKDVSSVLTIDVSGSMSSSNLNMAKNAATLWINSLKTNPSECAITSFDNISYLNQDFTYDKAALLNSVNSLQAKGGTDYNAGFLSAFTGSLEICKTGLNKKVIIFLSDGHPGTVTKTQDIINIAKQNNIEIYTITLGMKCPQDLREIATNTNGLWFENVITSQELEDIYMLILNVVQNLMPCTLEWESVRSCYAEERIVDVELPSFGLNKKLKYNVDIKEVMELKMTPYSLSLLNSVPGIARDTIIKVTAIGGDFNITDIVSTNLAFSVSPKQFQLAENQTIDLKVSVIPPDSSYIFTKFTIINDICESNYYVNAGFWGKSPKVKTLKIIHPNGGEVFVAGSDTLITWEGILPSEKVKIDYSTDGGLNWIIITDTASGLKYKWTVPKTPSNYCLARVTTKLNYSHYDDDMVLIPAGSFTMGSTGANNPNDQWEKPNKKVNITKDFLMSKYEITQKKFKEIMGTNPSPKIGDSLPVEKVTWYEAIEFCNKLSELAGLQPCYKGSGDNIVCDFSSNGYRLPTEAEWEYACKAGSSSDLWNGNLTQTDCSFDNNLNKIGWYCANSGGRAQNIAQKEANPFGLYDMNGNVCEWVWDWQGKFSSNEESDPTGPTTGQYRIVKGGSWQNYAVNCRSANRHYGYIPNSRHVFGFRIVRTY